MNEYILFMKTPTNKIDTFHPTGTDKSFQKESVA